MNIDHPKVVFGDKLFADKSVSVDDICETLKTSRTTLYRYVRLRGNSRVRG